MDFLIEHDEAVKFVLSAITVIVALTIVGYLIFRFVTSALVGVPPIDPITVRELHATVQAIQTQIAPR